MTLIIECETLRQSYRWTLRPGECARIGRSPWVEFSVSGDLAIANEHLRIDYSHHPEWNWIAPTPQNLTSSLNEALGVSNHTAFFIGSTQFQITWVQRSLHECHSLRHEVFGAELESASELHPWNVDREGLEELGIKTDVVKQLDGCTSPMEAALRWRKQGQIQEALRLIAWELGHQSRIAWLIESIPKERVIADVVERMNTWLNEPSESKRQSTALRMECLQTSAPEYWFLGAIAWTGGSLSANPSPVITPPRSLPVLAAVTALQLASSQVTEFDLIDRAISIGLESLRVEGSTTRSLANTGDLDACRS
jgi:hypothetical protein